MEQQVLYSLLLVPVGNHLNLFVQMRDTMDGITEYNLSSVTVISESISLSEQSFIELLSIGTPNTIGQVITLLIDEFNRIHNEMIEKAIRNGIALTSISISSLGTRLNIPNSRSINESARLEFLKEINCLADFRGYFIQFTSELTNGINQLTRTTLVSAANQCSNHCYSASSMCNKYSQCYQWSITTTNRSSRERFDKCNRISQRL